MWRSGVGIVGLQPKRAEVILAGACIVKTVMDKLGQGSLIVSDRGLRHGLLVEQFRRLITKWRPPRRFFCIAVLHIEAVGLYSEEGR